MRAIRIRTWLAAAALALTPLAVAAQGSVTLHTYSTRFSDTQRGAGAAYTGRLVLRFYPSGIVNGNYALFDSARTTGVTGGRNGDAIWLRIPTLGSGALTGRIAPGGRIVAFAQRRGDRWEFVATPTR